MSHRKPVKLWAANTAAEAMSLAREAVERLVPTIGGLRPAVVFDVDETCLLNHRNEETHPDHFAVNPEVKSFYDWLVERDVDVYIVTARRKSDWSHKYLTAQLESLGYTNIKRHYMVTKPYDADPSASRFKRDARRRITEKHGSRVILNVGDQASDLFLVDPYSPTNGRLAQTLDPTRYYGFAPNDGVSMVAIKLRSWYVVD